MSDVIEIDGAKFKSCLFHELIFEDGTVLDADPECAKKLGNFPKENIVRKDGDIEFTMAQWFGTEEGRELVDEWEKKGYHLISSFIGSQAYPCKVVSPISTEETKRTPPPGKRTQLRKWGLFCPKKVNTNDRREI
tara:strand:+ start:14 stop:418 length:405 start_codon:yes stop_codon:yes gene_type:complete